MVGAGLAPTRVRRGAGLRGVGGAASTVAAGPVGDGAGRSTGRGDRVAVGAGCRLRGECGEGDEIGPSPATNDEPSRSSATSASSAVISGAKYATTAPAVTMPAAPKTSPQTACPRPDPPRLLAPPRAMAPSTTATRPTMAPTSTNPSGIATAPTISAASAKGLRRESPVEGLRGRVGGPAVMEGAAVLPAAPVAGRSAHASWPERGRRQPWRAGPHRALAARAQRPSGRLPQGWDP